MLQLFPYSTARALVMSHAITFGNARLHQFKGQATGNIKCDIKDEMALALSTFPSPTRATKWLGQTSAIHLQQWYPVSNFIVGWSSISPDSGTAQSFKRTDVDSL